MMTSKKVRFAMTLIDVVGFACLYVAVMELVDARLGAGPLVVKYSHPFIYGAVGALLTVVSAAWHTVYRRGQAEGAVARPLARAIGVGAIWSLRCIGFMFGVYGFVLFVIFMSGTRNAEGALVVTVGGVVLNRLCAFVMDVMKIPRPDVAAPSFGQTR